MAEPILIAGAGPTGLVLALSLAQRGTPFRLIDKDGGPGDQSRAMVVHARTLEFYRQFGFADAMVAAGVKVEAAHLREGDAKGGHAVMSVSFADVGAGISPYPFPLCYPQDDHERFLVDKLAEAGHAVEWGTRLESFAPTADGVRATLIDADGRTEEVATTYLCGCDGARSRVREGLGLTFSGGTYEQLYFVADVAIAGGFRRDLVISLDEKGFALLLPVRSRGVQRLIGLVPRGIPDKPDLGFEDIRAVVEPLAGVTVTAVNWFSTYRVHHRVAERFQVGRTFLLGDAGHIHSPAGGQGMNTGIGDAVNLGWKLAEVVAGRADPALLDSYEAERIGFARTLVATTDRAFTSMVAGGWRGALTRRILAPLFLTVATRFSAGRHAFFRTLSQAHIHYPDSPLSEGRAGHVAGGDRLPWAGEGGVDNFAPLRSLAWQVHVYGTPDPKVATACAVLDLPVHAFAWTAAAHEAGLQQHATYLVRPDGYVALAATTDAASVLRRYAARHALRFTR